MYNTDQWAVMEVLAAALPKRVVVKTKQIAERFKRRPNADRLVRNAYRKLRAKGHVEITDRGEYQLTQEGAKWYKKAVESGFKPKTPRVRKPSDKPRKAKAKLDVPTIPAVRKAAEPKAKKATKPVKKVAKAAKPVKKVAKKEAKKLPEKVAKAAKAEKKETPAPSNGVPEKAKAPSASTSDLSW